MNLENYHIYEVVGAEALAKIQAYRELSKQKSVNAGKWAESHGGVKALTRGQFCCGITTPAGAKPATAGWKKSETQPDPNSTWRNYNWRTKSGRKIEREINRDELRQCTSEGMAQALGAYVAFIDGDSRLRASQAFDENGRVILIVPKKKDNPDPTFDGCRPLKLSEYYAIKEAAEAKDEKAA